MNIRTVLKRLFLSLLLLSFLIVSTLVGLMFFGVTLDLSFLKAGVETTATSVLNREVSINGRVVFEFSTWPAIEVQNVHIANLPSHTEPVFFSAEYARLKLGILPLLKGNIVLSDVIAEDVFLHLENGTDGVPNWKFNTEPPSTEPGSEPNATTKPSESDGSSFFRLTSLQNLRMNNIELNYYDAAIDKAVDFKLDIFEGTAAQGEPVVFDIFGSLQNRSFDLEFKGAPIEHLLSRGKESWQFTLNGTVAEKIVAVTGDFVLLEGKPQANLGFTIDDVDIGTFLSNLGLVEGLVASTGSMGLEFSVKGNSLDEILRESSMSFSVRDGKWRIASPTSDTFIDVDNLNGDISVEEGNAVTMKLTGTVGTLPVNFLITGAPLVDYVVDQSSVPLTVETEFADNYLSFGGELDLPITSRQLRLFLDFKTENLQNLTDILGVELPSIGPIDLETSFQLTGTQYEMDKLDIQVGGSHLSGQMLFDPSKEIPKVDISLISKHIQVNDFTAVIDALPDRSKSGSDQYPATADEQTSGEPLEDTPGKDRKNILSRDVLSAFHANLLIQAEEVSSGEDKLGAAILEMSIKDSLLTIDPLAIEIPGGRVHISFDYLPEPDGVTVNLAAEIDEFDVGILVRRSKPDTDMGGLVFFDVSLHSKAPRLSEMMQHADGHFDFGLVPKNFSAGIIDLWAVNLISAIMTEVSEKEQSQINCAVVRFGMQDGIMDEKAIYMDTSKMRVAGKATIDFKKRNFKVIMAPKAKQPQFFSLAVPIKVDGTFDDFNFGIGLARLTSAVFSFITSPVHVPIRRVFTDDIPEDGKEACLKAWTLTEEEKPKRTN